MRLKAAALAAGYGKRRGCSGVGRERAAGTVLGARAASAIAVRNGLIMILRRLVIMQVCMRPRAVLVAEGA